MSVESAVASWVICPARLCTTFGRLSMASTSVPRRTTSRAIELPKRPRPVTTTGSLAFSTNDHTLLGKSVTTGALPQGESGADRDRSDPAHEHEQGEQHLPHG